MSVSSPLRHPGRTASHGRAARAFRAFTRDGEEGQALIVIATTMLGMLFAVGLAIDSGQLFSGRRTAQEAADAAAFGGATVLYQAGTVAQALSAAAADATLNGYSTNVPTSGTTVTVSSPPSSGAFSGNASYVEVIISTPVRTSLVPAQSSLTTVRARAVAGNVSTNTGYAVMALDQTCTAGDVGISSNGTLALAGGGIAINSCSSSAGQNSGTVTISGGYETDVVGNVTGSWPNLHTGQSVKPDPFAGLAKPSTSGLSSYSPACSPTINQPGIYTSSFSSNCDYLFAPGTYILKGGGISLAGNSSMCTGTACSTPTAAGGTFFYVTNSSYPSTGGSCATIALNGNNTSTLSAPTTGTYAGMLFWQDSACTATFSIGGNGAINATGTIYAPGATVAGNGNNAVVNVSQIVAKRVDTQNADFAITYSNTLTYQGLHPAVVE